MNQRPRVTLATLREVAELLGPFSARLCETDRARFSLSVTQEELAGLPTDGPDQGPSGCATGRRIERSRHLTLSVVGEVVEVSLYVWNRGDEEATDLQSVADELCRGRWRVVSSGPAEDGKPRYAVESGASADTSTT